MPVDAQMLADLQPFSPEEMQLSSVVGSAVVTILAFLTAQQLKGKARVIGALQLWVVAMLATFLGREIAQTLPLPMSYLGAISVGMLAAESAENFHDKGDRKAPADKVDAAFVSQLQSTDLIEARLELIKQDEVDRRMLAADLHDQVLNDLKTLRQNISNLKDLPADRASELDGLVSRSMTGVREVMDNLSPVDIEHLGLSESLRACLEKAGEKAGVNVSFEAPAADVLDKQLSKIEATLLYRLVQESSNNIVKHASAGKIMGQVKIEDGCLLVRVVDDGKGINPETFSTESRGMRYMRLRADLIGSTIAWKPRQSGSGTIVEIRFQRDAEKTI